MKTFLFLLLVLLHRVTVGLCVLEFDDHEASDHGPKKLAEGLTLPGDYDPKVIPSKPLKIDVTCRVEEVLDVDIKEQIIVVKLDLGLSWQEPRMLVNVTEDILSVESKFALRTLWSPQPFIHNLVRYRQMEVLEQLTYVKVYPANKTVVMFSLGLATISCQMHFADFPMDEQLCPFLISSTTYQKDDVILTANHELSHVHVSRSYFVSVRDATPSDISASGVNLNFSQVGFMLLLRRKWATHIFTDYLPGAIIVWVSFISFIIPADAIPGRIALLVTLFLVLITFFGDVQTSIPRTGSLTALSIYILACLCFVFFAMIEFAYLLHINRRFDNKAVGPFVKSKNKKIGKCRTEAEVRNFCYNVDWLSFVGFNFSFCVFNMVYAMVYSMSQKH